MQKIMVFNNQLFHINIKQYCVIQILHHRGDNLTFSKVDT